MNEFNLMNHEKYTTADFALITFLSLKFPILDINKSDPKRVYFSFEKTLECMSAVESFWAGTASVEPGRYHSQTRFIKYKIAENA